MTGSWRCEEESIVHILPQVYREDCGKKELYGKEPQVYGPVVPPKAVLSKPAKSKRKEDRGA